MQDFLDLLTQAGYLEENGRSRVRSLCAEGRSLDEALRASVSCTEEQLLTLLSSHFEVPLADLEKEHPDPAFLARFPAKILLERHLLPLREENGVVIVASACLFDSTPVAELRVACERDVQIELAPQEEIDRWLKRLLGVGADTLQSLQAGVERVEVLDEDEDQEVDLSEAAQDASIVKFVNQILAEAITKRATDVHFEPFEDQLRVRYRIDGVLAEANVPPTVGQFRAAIVSRLKILSHLDIAEKRLPQDGRVKLKIAGREIDVRVSVIPMLHGEAVVLRILDRSATMLGLGSLGMAERDLRTFQTILELPHGIVLVTGPTGSGKTTTLYAGLSQINTIDRKIITIEDPIEYHLRGINQIQVSEKRGLTFARGLRAVLRHDPDVILVGEIRDKETAAIAVQASLTGHLVFSTLHTNDAPGALTRLVDMGIEPYLVASSLELVMAQRLIRLLCPACKEALPAEEIREARKTWGSELPQVLYRGTGCRECEGTGYRGRQGIFELMPITDEIRALVLANRSANEIRAVAVKQGMRSLREDGFRVLREGKTTLEEILRVTKDQRTEAEKEQASRAKKKRAARSRRATVSPEEAAAQAEGGTPPAGGAEEK